MSAHIRALVITISDRCSRGEAEDLSGARLVTMLKESGAEVVDKIVVSDDLEPLAEILMKWSENVNVDLIMTTGGTGFAERDNTPEATRKVIEREAPGLAEAMRAETLRNTKFAMLSRGVCGIRGKCLIVNLPGSPKGVAECFHVIEPVLRHAVNQIKGISEH